MDNVEISQSVCKEHNDCLFLSGRWCTRWFERNTTLSTFIWQKDADTVGFQPKDISTIMVTTYSNIIKLLTHCTRQRDMPDAGKETTSSLSGMLNRCNPATTANPLPTTSKECYIPFFIAARHTAIT